MNTETLDKMIHRSEPSNDFRMYCLRVLAGNADHSVVMAIERGIADPETLDHWLRDCESATNNNWMGFPPQIRPIIAEQARIEARNSLEWRRFREQGLVGAFQASAEIDRPHVLRMLATILFAPELLSEFEVSIFSAPSLPRAWAAAQASLGIEHGVEVCLYDVAAGTRHRVGHGESSSDPNPFFVLHSDSNEIVVEGFNLERFLDRVVNAALFRLGDQDEPYVGLHFVGSEIPRPDLINYETWRQQLSRAESVIGRTPATINPDGTCECRLPMPPADKLPLTDKVLVIALTTRVGPADQAKTGRSGGKGRMRGR